MKLINGKVFAYVVAAFLVVIATAPQSYAASCEETTWHALVPFWPSGCGAGTCEPGYRCKIGKPFDYDPPHLYGHCYCGKSGRAATPFDGQGAQDDRDDDLADDLNLIRELEESLRRDSGEIYLESLSE